MQKSRIVKTLTLFSFIFLLTSFIAFKEGAFDNYFNQKNRSSRTLNSEKPNEIGVMPIDTPPAEKVDTVKVNPTMLSTSKSMILLDQKIEYPIKDSLTIDSNNLTPKK